MKDVTIYDFSVEYNTKARKVHFGFILEPGAYDDL